MPSVVLMSALLSKGKAGKDNTLYVTSGGCARAC